MIVEVYDGGLVVGEVFVEGVGCVGIFFWEVFVQGYGEVKFILMIEEFSV